MEQTNKELLIKDISARLKYGVKASVYSYWNESYLDDYIVGVDIEEDDFLCSTIPGGRSEIILTKPYLFPLSSMTEEQKEEYTHIVNYISSDDTDNWKEGEFIYVEQLEQLLHFYHKNHLDYRDLISIGLAINCTNLNIY